MMIMPHSFNPLSPDFYKSSARVVARKLLGHWLIRQTSAGPIGGMIVETEAYLAANDPACHAATGRSVRNQTMWGRNGLGYIYMIYGLYYCFNTVCRPEGIAEAVLIRAIQPDFGLDWMLERRGGLASNLTSGPSKLCLAMNIDRKLDGVDLCNPESELIVAENPNIARNVKDAGPIIVTTRIGITKAADLPLRYYLSGSAYVSKRCRLKDRLTANRSRSSAVSSTLLH
jgi:DNA-3-methyladenine glycosylase